MSALLLPAILLALLLLPVLAVRSRIGGRAQADHRAWSMRWRILFRMRPGPGFGTFPELVWRMSRARAALDHGRRARPGLGFSTLTTHTTDYAVRFGRAQYGRRVYGRMQDQTLILCPQQTGKSGMLADRIVDHPGPIICTSTRDDLYRNTAAERMLRGELDVWNPLQIGVPPPPSTFAWDIIAGCEDPATAIRRAQDLTGDYPAGDMKWWQSKASASLASLLHAAALAPWAAITDVYEWVNRHGDSQAEEILDTAPGASSALRATLEEIRRAGKTADSVRATISECLTWVAIPALAAAASPAPGEGFSVPNFLWGNGTLYMIAPGTETAPVAPLFQAFVQHVHYEAGLIGSRSPGGKLDPPLWYALDELTQVCPLPLPQMLADSAGKGILITGVAHSYGHLEARWGKPGAEAIWSTSSTKILMGGITDPVTLEHVARVCGTVGPERQAAVPPELLRMLPRWRALVLTLDRRPVIVKTRPIWHRWGHRFGRMPAPLPAPAPACQPAPVTPAGVRATAPLGLAVPPPASPGPVIPVTTAGSSSNGHHHYPGPDDE